MFGLRCCNAANLSSTCFVCMYECVGYAASVITQHTTPPPLRETSEAKVEETLMQ